MKLSPRRVMISLLSVQINSLLFEPGYRTIDPWTVSLVIILMLWVTVWCRKLLILIVCDFLIGETGEL